MNRRADCITGIVLWLGLAVAVPGFDLIHTNVFELASGETLANETWLGAGRITLNGEARDDVFLLAGADRTAPASSNGVITLAGDCRDDVWALADRVEIGGRAGGHVRAAARTVRVTGEIGKGALLMGSAVSLAPESHLAGTARLIGENLVAEGCVEGRLTLLGNKVTLSGSFSNDVRVTAQDVVVLPGTRIGGDLVYTAPSELILDKGVSLGGRLVRQPAPAAPANAWSSLFVKVWLGLAALLAGIVLFRLFPRFALAAADRLRYSFWKCLLTGFVILALTPLLCLAGLVSFVGLPLALLLAMAALILVYLSKLVVAVFLGRFGRRTSAWFWPMAVGLALLTVGTSAGALGAAIWMLTACAGTGSLALAMATRPPEAVAEPPPLPQAPPPDLTA